MSDFLNILETLFGWMRSNGLPLHVGSFSGFISFFELFIGLAVLDIAIYWLFKFFMGD